MKRKSGLILSITLLCGSVAGCMNNCQNTGEDFLKDVVTRENYQSVYAKIGKDITLDQVREEMDGRHFSPPANPPPSSSSGSILHMISFCHHSCPPRPYTL